MRRSRIARVAGLAVLAPTFALAVSVFPGCGSRAGVRGPSPTVEEMYAHFGRAQELTTGVIRGDLDAVRGSARRIAADPGAPGLPPGSEPYVEALREAAREAARAPSPEAAAMAASRVSGACGSCHAALDAGPRFVLGAPPPAVGGATNEMVLHIWGADRLLEGLVGPSDEMWLTGAGVLAAAPLHPTRVLRGMRAPDDVVRMAENVHEAAARAAREDAPEARVRSYGTVLESCARCHDRVGVRLR